jgi:hypothetical protein
MKSAAPIVGFTTLKIPIGAMTNEAASKGDHCAVSTAAMTGAASKHGRVE